LVGDLNERKAMPDKIVKQVETVITAKDDSAAGIASFEDRMKKAADDVPNYITGRTGGDNAALDRMRNFYQKLEDIEAKAQIPKEAGIFAGGRSIDTSSAVAAGETLGKASGEASAKTFAQEFGRGNPLAQTFRILAGGGALLAVDRLAKGIGEAAHKADDLYLSFKKGQISAGEMVGELARSTPLLGDFVKLGDSIGKLARDIAGLPSADDKLGAHLDEVEQHRKEVAEQQKQEHDRFEKRQKIIDDVKKTTGGISSEAGLAGLEGPEKAQAENLEKFNKRQHEIAADEAKLGSLSVDQQADAHKRLDMAKLDALKIYEAEQKRITADADKQEGEKKQKDQDFADHMTDLQKRLADKMAEDFAEQNRKQDEDARKQIDIDEQLQRIKIDDLQASGNLSKNDEKRLQVAESFLERRKQLQKITEDENATSEQKEKARGLLGGLAAAEAAAEARAVRTPRVGTATAEEAGQLHGLATQAVTRAADPMSELNATSKEQSKDTKAARELLQQIASMLALTHGSNPALIKAG
jgi:hypothetical protein